MVGILREEDQAGVALTLRFVSKSSEVAGGGTIRKEIQSEK